MHFKKIYMMLILLFASEKHLFKDHFPEFRLKRQHK